MSSGSSIRNQLLRRAIPTRRHIARADHQQTSATGSHTPGKRWRDSNFQPTVLGIRAGRVAVQAAVRVMTRAIHTPWTLGQLREAAIDCCVERRPRTARWLRRTTKAHRAVRKLVVRFCTLNCVARSMQLLHTRTHATGDDRMFKSVDRMARGTTGGQLHQ
jgi:hypothetical protein